MSEHAPNEDQPETPPEGDEAPPSVDPIAPPEPAVEDVQPVGRTPEAEAGEPATDQEQGVGVAPTQPGDAGEGNVGTRFQTTEEIEGTGSGDDGDVAEHI
jgi:hypothetical protein